METATEIPERYAHDCCSGLCASIRIVLPCCAKAVDDDIIFLTSSPVAFLLSVGRDSHEQSVAMLTCGHVKLMWFTDSTPTKQNIRPFSASSKLSVRRDVMAARTGASRPGSALIRTRSASPGGRENDAVYDANLRSPLAAQRDHVDSPDTFSAILNSVSKFSADFQTKLGDR
eukprot:1648046-Rhodomonas_salina.4